MRPDSLLRFWRHINWYLLTYLLTLADHAELGIRRRYCVEEWPSERLRCGYALLTFAGQFGVPLAVSAALYWLIYRRIQQRRRPRGHIGATRRCVPRTYLHLNILLRIGRRGSR